MWFVDLLESIGKIFIGNDEKKENLKKDDDLPEKYAWIREYDKDIEMNNNWKDPNYIPFSRRKIPEDFLERVKKRNPYLYEAKVDSGFQGRMLIRELRRCECSIAEQIRKWGVQGEGPDFWERLSRDKRFLQSHKDGDVLECKIDNEIHENGVNYRKGEIVYVKAEKRSGSIWYPWDKKHVIYKRFYDKGQELFKRTNKCFNNNYLRELYENGLVKVVGHFKTVG